MRLPFRYAVLAVLLGLLGATVTTLFVVPIFYTYLRTKPPVDQARLLEAEEEAETLEPSYHE